MRALRSREVMEMHVGTMRLALFLVSRAGSALIH